MIDNDDEQSCPMCNGTERLPCPNGCSGGDYCNRDGCDCDNPGNPGTIYCPGCNPNLTREESGELYARLRARGYPHLKEQGR
jgi:hypothetical protein